MRFKNEKKIALGNTLIPSGCQPRPSWDKYFLDILKIKIYSTFWRQTKWLGKWTLR